MRIETVTDEFGRKAVIHLSPKTGEFYAIVSDVRVTAKDLEKCRRDVKDALASAARIVWQPMIVVTGNVKQQGWQPRQGLYQRDTSTTYGASFNFAFHRLEIGYDPIAKRDLGRPLIGPDGLTDDDREYVARHPPAERDRVAERRRAEAAKDRASGDDVSTYWGRSENAHLIPYTDEMWERLTTMRAQLVEIGQRLLSETGMKLLGPGDDSDADDEG